jgi:hypothetical protein
VKYASKPSPRRRVTKRLKKLKHKPGECVHSDLLHSTVTSHKGNKYFLVVKDEGSSFRQVYFQKEKSKEKRVHGNKPVVNYVHF